MSLGERKIREGKTMKEIIKGEEQREKDTL